MTDLLEGFSLHPEDWIKNQQTLYSSADKSASVTPVVSPPNTQNVAAENLEQNPAATVDEDISSDETETKTETNDVSDDSVNEDGQELKVCVGETEKLVAHSKLQALLAQFEKTKEFPPIETAVRPSVSEPQLLSTSPANFSHLVGSAGVESSNSNLSVKSNMARYKTKQFFFNYDFLNLYYTYII